jgi:hypothetical protein
MNSYFVNEKAPTLAITYDTTVSSSTTVTFNTKSTYILVSAINNGIFMKWGATASSSAFDEFIPAGYTWGFVILTDPTTGVKYTTAQFIEETASAKLVVIEK